MAKLTLAEKKLINEHVTGETKRCMAILKKIEKYPGLTLVFNELIKEMIEGSPFIEFHPELLKRIPK